MSEKAFEKWITTTSLRSTAKTQLPEALSPKFKKKILERTDVEEIIAFAIDEINRGSIETIDSFVRKRLK